MNPVAQLQAEHDVTRGMLDVLEQIATGVAAGRAFPAGDTATVLTYFRDFVEHVHHVREANFCYPLVTMVGSDAAVEAVGELVADHEESKLLLQSLTTFWEPDDLLEAERAVFAEWVHTYVARLRRHMELEETAIFDAVRQLPGDDRTALVEDFASIGTGRRDLASWREELARLQSASVVDDR